MAQVQLVLQTVSQDVNNSSLLVDVTIDTIFTPIATQDSDIALARSLWIALNTDGLALPDDILPYAEDTDRRGWVGDYQTEIIWGAWPIGSRLWLLERAKMTVAGSKQGSITALVQQYLTEVLEPYRVAAICESYDITIMTPGPSTITAKVVMHRGAKSSIALVFSDLWNFLSA